MALESKTELDGTTPLRRIVDMIRPSELIPARVRRMKPKGLIIRLRPDTYEAARKHAGELGMKFSDYCEEALRELLDDTPFPRSSRIHERGIGETKPARVTIDGEIIRRLKIHRTRTNTSLVAMARFAIRKKLGMELLSR